MVRLPFALLLAALVATPGPGCVRVPADLDDPQGTPGAPTSASEVLTRYVEAIGGEKALRALKNRTVEARMTFLPDDDCKEGDEGCLAEEESGTFILQTTGDGRLYRRTVLGDLIEERGYDGKQGWQVLADGTVRLESPEESAISREDARLHWYLDVDQAGVEATLLPPRKTDSDGETRTLDGLRWDIPGDGATPPKTLWFDRSTGLLREEIIEDGEGEQYTSQVIIYRTYMDVDGIKVPKEIELVTTAGSNRRVVQFFTTAVHHDALDAKLFAVPAPQKPPKQPDPRRARLQAAQAAAKDAPDDAAAQIALARAAYQDARFALAAEAAEATLAIERDEPEALFLLAKIAVMEGEYPAAKKWMKKAASAGVRQSELARQQAWVASHQRNYRKMAGALDEAEQPMLAGRYRAFAGSPFRNTISTCRNTVPLARMEPTPAVELTVGDHTVLALIDTGATDTILDHELAGELGVPIHARTPLGQGAGEISHGQLEALTLGDVTLQNVPVDVFDGRAIASMAGELEPGVVRAVVGLRTLELFQVTLDLPGKKMVLVPRTRKCRKDAQVHRTGEPVPFWLHETHFVYVPGALNGEPGLFLLNTGMRGVAVTANRPAYAIAGVPPPVLRPGQPALVQIDTVEVGNAIDLQNVTAAYGFFQQSETADGFRIDGMLGLDALAGHTVTVDFDTRKIYVRKPS